MKKKRAVGSVLLAILMWYAIIAGIVAIGAFVLENFFLCSGYLNTCGRPGVNLIIALIVGLAWPVILPLYVYVFARSP